MNLLLLSTTSRSIGYTKVWISLPRTCRYVKTTEDNTEMSLTILTLVLSKLGQNIYELPVWKVAITAILSSAMLKNAVGRSYN